MTTRATSPWLNASLTALVLALTLSGFVATGELITYGENWRTVVTWLALSAAAAAASRFFTRNRVIPTAFTVLIAALTGPHVLLPRAEGSLGTLPSPSAWRQVLLAGADGYQELLDSPAPAPATPSITVLVSMVAVIVFIIAEGLAVSAKAAALAGAFIFLPWLPVVILQWRVPGVLLWLSLAAWVLLMILTRTTSELGHSSIVPSFLAAGASLGLAAVLGPIFIGGPGWGALPDILVGQTPDGTTQLDLDLDLRDSLTVNSSTPVLVYTSSGDRPDALRTHTFTDFDGVSWSRQEDAGPSVAVGEDALWPQPEQISSFWGEGLTRISIQTLGFAGFNLPISVGPRSVRVDGDFSYVPGRDEVVTETTSLKDLTYTVDADLNYVMNADLASLGWASGQDSQLGPEFLAINDNIDADALRALAQQVTADSSSRLEQAAALQNYLRDPSLFTYDTAVEPSGSDSVAVFLEQRSGYCVQFATTMVMMARTLGIPARLAIGFLPGTRDQGDVWVVRGSHAHAWPELYFESVGWVRFEPTPAVQTGPPPVYDASASEPAPEPDQPSAPASLEPSAPPPGDDGVDPEIPAPTPDSPAQEPRSNGVLIATLLGLAVVAGLAIAALLVRRARARRRDRETLESLWEGLRTRLPQDWTWSASATPAQAAALVTAKLANQEVSQDVIDRIAAVFTWIESRRYEVDGDLVERDLDQVRAVAAELLGLAKAKS